MRLLACVAIGIVLAAAAPAAEGPGKVLDQQLKMVENEVVSLAEAMPAEKYNFAPTQGEFTGVRTFGQQVTHLAVVIHMCAASVLEEPIPEGGPGENGPPSLKSKQEIVSYLKESFAHAHKAMGSLTAANLMDLVPPAFGKNKTPRLSMADVPVWHSFDHYGQMVVYARMNGVVPPASRR